MKKSIKKLEALGLSKEQIMSMLNINNEQFARERKLGRSFEIDNLPEKLDFLTKGGTIEDLKKARWYIDDKIKMLEDECKVNS